LYRARGDENLAVLNVLLLDDVDDGFEQKIVTVQQDAIDLLYLRASEYPWIWWIDVGGAAGHYS
jgi:hypothetical protein